MKHIIAIYSFTFINKTSNEILLFNVIDKAILTTRSKTIYTIFNSQVRQETSKYYFEFDNKLLDNNEFISFIKELNNKNMGEVIIKKSEEYPILFSPILNIGKHDYLTYLELLNHDTKDTNFNKEKRNVLGNKILNNIKEITIHINSLSNNYIFYNNANKQHSFPLVNAQEEINLSLLFKFINFNFPYKPRLNLIIAKISAPIIKEINHFIDKLNNRFNIYMFTISENKHLIKQININYKNIFIWVLPFTEYDKINDYNQIGIFSNTEEFNYYDDNYNNFLYCYPYYTEKNKDFCINNLKFNLSDIIEEEINETILFSHKILNNNLFGRLTISPSGEIYSCINKPSLGNICNDSIKKIILKELTISKNWFQTRMSITPCSDCKYNILCPSITDFEIFMNCFNICDPLDKS